MFEVMVDKIGGFWTSIIVIICCYIIGYSLGVIFKSLKEGERIEIRKVK